MAENAKRNPSWVPPAAAVRSDVAKFIAEAQHTIYLIRAKLLEGETHGQSDTVQRG